ncbi:hypothetical protein [Streptomyces sp. NPDC059949]|uniref:hypothetical protein n=1 Tax=Streptomyces sp. NPDC059949 TaxID=3347013 RepID=UPI0036624034
MSDIAIARRLGVNANSIVAPIRRSLGLPKHKPGPAPAPSVDAFVDAHGEDIDGGHIRWTGYLSKGIPQIRYAGHQRESVYRFVFRKRHGREPVGYALPACGVRLCVNPEHIDDRDARQRNRATFNALFGAAL